VTRDETPDERPCLVVGVGASAGGVDAFGRLLEALEDLRSVAFVLVAHHDGERDAHLVDELECSSAMAVVPAVDGVQLRGGTVYVVPPAAAATVCDGRITLKPAVAEGGAPAVIDQLFQSLAEEGAPRAAGILLSGVGCDGAVGLREIRAAGGLTIAQDPATAPQPGMLQHAIRMGAAELVVPIEGIPARLARFVVLPSEATEPLEGDKGELERAKGQARLSAEELVRLTEVLAEDFDVAQYKPGTVERRVLRRMGLGGFAAFEDYLIHLRGDEAERAALARDLLIHVTRFFRDSAAFEELEQRVAVPLVQGAVPGETLRVWVPGASTGEEAYSIAMVLLETMEAQGVHLELQVFATDPDEDALTVGRSGVYPPTIADHVSRERLERFFTPDAEHGFRVRSHLRETISFAVHDLCKNPPFARMHLVSCRNVLIYLRPPAQTHVLQVLHFALRPGGVLWLGTNESAGADRLFADVSKRWRIFRKVGRSRPLSGRPGVWKLRPSQSVEPLSAPDADNAERRQADLARTAIMRTRVAPTVVVGEDDQIVFMHGDLGTHLRFPEGELRRDLCSFLQEELATRTRAALHRCRRNGETVTALSRPDGPVGRQTCITASPAPEVCDGAVVLTFEVIEPEAAKLEQQVDHGPHDAIVGELERELQATREDLRNTVEQLESSNEELRAVNEESVSMNEELQSSNEELEATTEELRSLNDELTSVNVQLRKNVEELEQANDDLSNFFASTKLATLFLDTELRITRVTPAAAELLSLDGSDEQRHVGDIARELLQADLVAEGRSVLEHLAPRRRELQVGDQWFIRTVLPYQTGARRVDGVVVTLTDVTELRRATEQLTQREARQVVLMRLGMQALEAPDLESFLNQAVREVQQVLGTDYCKILELSTDEQTLLLRSGVGWKEGLVGIASVSADLDSQAGFTLQAGEPVIVDDLTAERRFTGPRLLHEYGVKSGLSCVIGGGDHVYGVLGAHTRSQRAFTVDDAAFLQRVADVVSSTVERHQMRTRMMIEAAVAKVLAESESLENAARGIHRALAETLGTSIGELWWPAAGNESALVCTVSTATDHDPRIVLDTDGLEFHRGEGFIGRVWERGEAGIIVPSDPSTGFVQREAAQALRLETGLAVPILSGGRTLGVLVVFSKRRLLTDPPFLRSMEWIGRATGELFRRFEAETAIRDREERIRDVFENVGVSVWELELSGVRRVLEGLLTDGVEDLQDHFEANPALVDEALTKLEVLQVNSETLRLFGAASLDELVAGLDQVFVAESMAALAKVLSAFTRGSRSFAVETRLGTLGGGRIECTLSVRMPSISGSSSRFLLSIMDTTIIGRARLELEESRRWFKGLTEATPDVVSVYDVVEDRTVYANRETLHVLGYTPQELTAMGKGVGKEIVHVDDLDEVRRFFSSLGQSGASMSGSSRGSQVAEQTYRVRHRNGEYRWLHARAVPFRTSDHGQIREALVVARDITEFKRAEDDLREAGRQKDAYLAMLGHELRNPLAAVRSATELMKLRSGDAAGLHRVHDVLDRQTTHMAKLVDGLLDVSRLVRGKIELDRERLSFVAVLRDIVADRAEDVRRKGLELRTDFSADPLWIDGDRVRLVQIVENLLSNALDHTNAPGTITVSTKTENGEAVVDVQDTGVGIDPELLPHIFEAFRQAGQSLDRSKGGLGLGLALVKGLIELHDGQVVARSEGTGKGTVFELRVPLAPGAPRASSAKAGSTRPRRILIVEDNQDAADLLSRLLELDGHQVWSADTGSEGVELAREVRPDVVLCDLGLPGAMSGFDVARILRHDEVLRDALLIAITGYGRPEDKQRSAQAGFDAHVTKPVDMRSLKELLERGAEPGNVPRPI
jgi:two-component system, chemotaxis family, CheB/CheR fusion protein